MRVCCVCACVRVCWARDCAVSPLLLPNEWLHSLCQYFSDNISVNLFPSSCLSRSLCLFLPCFICPCLSVRPFAFVCVYLLPCLFVTLPPGPDVCFCHFSHIALCFVPYFIYILSILCNFSCRPLPSFSPTILTQVDPAAVWVCVCVCAGQPVPTVNVITHKF